MTVLDQTTDLALSAAMREGSLAEHQAAVQAYLQRYRQQRRSQ